MISNRPMMSIFLLTILLVALFATLPTTVTVSADLEDDLIQAREDLNTTRAKLAKVEKERDDYAQRLEDSTTILIVSLILLIGSYFVFFMNTRRAKIALMEYQKRTGVTPSNPNPKPRRRRRG